MTTSHAPLLSALSGDDLPRALTQHDRVLRQQLEQFASQDWPA